MDQEVYASFWEHIDELRAIFLKIAAIALAGVLIAFTFHQPIISFLTGSLVSSPLQQETIETIRISNSSTTASLFTLPDNATIPETVAQEIQQVSPRSYLLPPKSSLTFSKTLPHSLILLNPLEGVLIAFKTSLWIGITATSPLWLLLLLRFISPALNSKERRIALPFIVTTLLLVLLGAFFALLVTIPIANNYFFTFNDNLGQNLWSLQHYLDYTFFLILANSIAFELAAIGFFAVHLGIVSADWLIGKRRIAIVLLLILSALLTPPDVLTQLLLAFPLFLLYECVILYAKMRHKIRCQ